MKTIRIFCILLAVMGILAGCADSAETETTENTTAFQAHPGHKSGDPVTIPVWQEGRAYMENGTHFESPNLGYCIDYLDSFRLVDAVDSQTWLWGYTADEMPETNYLRIYVIRNSTAEAEAGHAEGERGEAVVSGLPAITVTAQEGDHRIHYYFMDAPGGCFVIETRCMTEGLEGIGSAMSAMINTLVVYP